MFRVVKDDRFSHYYIHKKFLWFWVKWSRQLQVNEIPTAMKYYGFKPGKTNFALALHEAVKIFKSGKYDFSIGEKSHFFYIMDENTSDTCTITYYNNVQEFMDDHAEDLI